VVLDAAHDHRPVGIALLPGPGGLALVAGLGHLGRVDDPPLPPPDLGTAPAQPALRASEAADHLDLGDLAGGDEPLEPVEVRDPVAGEEGGDE
jgi:hypothetical protein